jgi:hypothetical protein
MHFYLWTEPAGQNNAYFKYGLVEILSPKALVPEVIAVKSLLLLIYFQMYQSLLQYLKKM